MKAELTNGNVTSETWARAHNRCLRARLDDRYLQPIKTIQSNGSFIGEGFAILTLQCSLIEFLAALRLGLNYRTGAQFGEKNEYGQSGKLYAEFLAGQPPFSDCVPNLASAYEFYRDVRCGLVHEAQTKNGWKVWAYTSTNQAIDFGRKIVNRDLLGDAIETYLAQYEAELIASVELQNAFVRKLDYIYRHSTQ